MMLKNNNVIRKYFWSVKSLTSLKESVINSMGWQTEAQTARKVRILSKSLIPCSQPQQKIKWKFRKILAVV